MDTIHFFAVFVLLINANEGNLLNGIHTTRYDCNSGINPCNPRAVAGLTYYKAMDDQHFIHCGWSVCYTMACGDGTSYSQFLNVCIHPKCTSMPCLNGGTCHEYNHLMCVCECSEGWTGRNCDIALICAQDSPCLNGATCVETENGAAPTCICTQEWTGSNCGTALLCEQDNPCLNGARCVETDRGADPTCICSAEWTGIDCGTALMCVQLNPCLNSGMCVETGYSAAPTCVCPPEWTGWNCGTEFAGICYTLVDPGMTWEDAKVHCADNSWTLAAVCSAAEQAAIADLTSEYGMYYLGGSALRPTRFQWHSNRCSFDTYQNWAPGSPIGDQDHDCLVLVNRNHAVVDWADQPCTEELPFFCEHSC